MKTRRKDEKWRLAHNKRCRAYNKTYREKQKLKGGEGKKLGGNAKFSDTSLKQYQSIDKNATPKSLSKDLGLKQKLSKTKLKGRAGALIALASALMGGYNLLTEE